MKFALCCLIGALGATAAAKSTAGHLRASLANDAAAPQQALLGLVAAAANAKGDSPEFDISSLATLAQSLSKTGGIVETVNTIKGLVTGMMESLSQEAAAAQMGLANKTLYDTCNTNKAAAMATVAKLEAAAPADGHYAEYHKCVEELSNLNTTAKSCTSQEDLLRVAKQARCEYFATVDRSSNFQSWFCHEDDFPVSSSYESYLQRNIDMLAEYRMRVALALAFAKGNFSDTLLGECKFDLEDRWLALKWKDFRCSTSEEFLRNKVSPPAHGRFLWTSEDAKRGNLPWRAPEKPVPTGVGRGLEIRPARSSGARLPLETKMMSMKDHDVNSETRAGLLRCFLDMHPFNTPELPRRPEMQSFEVRVSVFAVDNIKVYKDFGQRNDLFVQMKFRSVNMDGEESKRVEKTDIHRWANEDASFNQRFLFEMSAPCLSMGVEFSLMDFDRGVSSADLVYYPQTLSLDHHLAIAYESWTSSRETIGPVSHTVVFDSWPATKMVLDRWRCCRCVRRRINQGNYAKMTCTVEIVATEVAAEHPVISGVFAPPQDRLSLQMLATNPVKTLRVLLGPQLFNLITVGTFLGCSLVVTFLIILTVFYAHALLTA